MDRQNDAPEASTLAATKAFVRLLLCTPRRWYFVLSLLLVLGIKYIYRPVLPMPVREYFTTYRIKYSDPGQGERASKSFVEDAYRPQWAMLNPYDRDMAIKYFESTKLVIDAGHKINYTVRYWRDGQDIYEHTPVDIRFTSDSISDFDSWSMRVEVLAQGVELTKIDGKYNGEPIKVRDKVFVPYNSPTDTPLGTIEARLIRPIGKYTKLTLTKMREVDAQDIYDAKMRRYMGSNLIELFLTADCTRGFAQDFFHQIGREYEQYAHAYYREELGKYLERLDEARRQITQGYDYLEQFGIKAKESDPATRKALLSQLDKMTEEAQTDALVLGESQMIEILDDTLIRSPKQGESSLPYVNLGLAILFLILPVLALVVELILRRPVLAPDLLPHPWGRKERHLRLPQGRASQLDWELFALQVGKILEDSGTDRLHIADCKVDSRYPLSNIIEAMPEALRTQLKVVPALNENLEGIKSFVEQGVPLIIRLRCGFTPEEAVQKLQEWVEVCGVSPIILWDNRL